MTTQYLEEADRLADRIAVVDKGRIIAQGTSKELKAQVGGDVVEVTVADAAGAQAVGRALKALKPQVEPSRGRVRVPAPKGAQTLAEVVKRLDAKTLAGAEVALRRPTLDDVFLALTGHAAQEENGGTDGKPGKPGKPAAAEAKR
jgi:ABC-2 type transport system ATP-binding protein